MNTCLNCGGVISETAYRFMLRDRRKGLPGSWQLVECNSCGVIFMLSMPTEEQLTLYYSAYSNNQKVNYSRGIGSRYPSFRKLFHRLSGDADPRDFVEIPNGGRILDYGCGQAEYLSDYHSRGVKISGAEMNSDVVKACQEVGYDVHKVNDLSSIPFADKTFDVVYLMQVFEHLRDPQVFMGELSRVTKMGGALYLAVPNSASIWRKIFSTNWVSGWFAPFHLFHYNSEALTSMAAKHGFVATKIWRNTPESWFRLNLKAFFYPNDNRLDHHSCWLDSRIIRPFIIVALRLIELPVRQRDCLIIKFMKCECNGR